MIQLRREVPDPSYEEFDKVNKPINFSKSPKLGWDFSQASLRTHSTQKSAQATSDRYNFSRLRNLLGTNRNPRLAGKIIRSLDPDLDWFAPIYDSKPQRALLTRELFALPDSNDSRANRYRVCATVITSKDPSVSSRSSQLWRSQRPEFGETCDSRWLLKTESTTWWKYWQNARAACPLPTLQSQAVWWLGL